MVTTRENLPWFTHNEIDNVAQAFNNNHAVLLSGAQGIGKSHLASMLMNTLFSKASTAEIKLINAGTHPDIHVLTSAYAFQHLDSLLQNLCFRYLDHDAIEKKRLSRQIGVDTIRTLVESMNEASSTGGCKLSIICPAEHMNINSANAILKFLEEPTAKTFLILVSHDISKLPATIRSRCMRINVGLPDVDDSVGWLTSKYPTHDENEIVGALELAGYRPLMADEYLSTDQQSIVSELQAGISDIAFNQTEKTTAIARKWAQYKQTDFILRWICQFFTGLIKIKLLDSNENANTGNRQQLLNLSQSFTSQNLFVIYDYLQSIKQGYDGVVDEILLIEDILQTIANNATQSN